MFSAKSWYRRLRDWGECFLVRPVDIILEMAEMVKAFTSSTARYGARQAPGLLTDTEKLHREQTKLYPTMRKREKGLCLWFMDEGEVLSEALKWKQDSRARML